MPLIKSLAEIKEVLPRLVSTLSNFNTLPNFERAEGKYIIPIIGRTLYDTLVAAYDAESLDADETTLVKKLRLVIAAYAFKDELGLTNVTITDSGPKKLASGSTERVFGWEYADLKNALITAATDGVDVLLAYLFDNKDLFPEWIGSEEYSKINSLLIKTGTDFHDNGFSLFQPSRTFYAMRGIMTDVQRLFIEEAIGKDLLAYLRDLAIDDQEDEEKEIIGYLKKAIAFFTIIAACKKYAVSFTDSGFTILGERFSNVDNQVAQAPDPRLLQMSIASCQAEGDSYLELARNKLVAYYNDDPEAGFKIAYDEGPLSTYVQPADRTSGNENRKSYSLP
jgi:hypothetical protein